MQIREHLKPYIRGLMEAAHEKGTPLMHPLFYDFPQDTEAWEADDQYMFGPDLLSPRCCSKVKVSARYICRPDHSGPMCIPAKSLPEDRSLCRMRPGADSFVLAR